MSIKEGDMVSIRQDFIDEYHKHEYNSKDIWELEEMEGKDHGESS